MKKEKGFTLIELLAVIVILAILMVIAVPKIINVINNSRKSASESSIKLLKDTIKTQVTSKDITNSNFEQDTSGCYLFDFDSETNKNVEQLKLKNKDRFSGSIKYCDGKFTNNTLMFDGKDMKTIVCKRATTLHTEECVQTDATYYCSGAGYTTSGSKGTTTITYGNLGTSGTLTSGDAFDCDVNGDGTYDPNTERFYYVSDYYNTSTKVFESDTAVLIYYNNVSAGNPSKNSLYAYDSSNENWHGPRTAVMQLPTTSQWSNVSLTNNVRSITTNTGGNTTTGGTTPSNFNYSGYAARILTIQEVRKGTGLTSIPDWKVGELDNFTYLLENTKFASDGNAAWSWWLENSRSDKIDSVWYVSGNGRLVSSDPVSSFSDRAIRPAIEVSKTNIEY